jgi:hypothetical protein
MKRRRVLVEPGRWTQQRPGETSSQAMKRLMTEGGKPLPLQNQRKPRFKIRGEEAPRSWLISAAIFFAPVYIGAFIGLAWVVLF